MKVKSVHLYTWFFAPFARPFLTCVINLCPGTNHFAYCTDSRSNMYHSSVPDKRTAFISSGAARWRHSALGTQSDKLRIQWINLQRPNLQLAAALPHSEHFTESGTVFFSTLHFYSFIRLSNYKFLFTTFLLNFSKLLSIPLLQFLITKAGTADGHLYL